MLRHLTFSNREYSMKQKLTPKQCRERAEAYQKAAEHLIIDKEIHEYKDDSGCGYVANLLLKQANKWFIKATDLECDETNEK